MSAKEGSSGRGNVRLVGHPQVVMLPFRHKNRESALTPGRRTWRVKAMGKWFEDEQTPSGGYFHRIFTARQALSTEGAEYVLEFL